MSDPYENREVLAARIRWAEVVEQIDALVKLAGLKDWERHSWAGVGNPFANGSDEHHAFEEIRQVGMALEKERCQLERRLKADRE